MRGHGTVVSFDALFEFEEELAKYTGAPYVVVTDGCTNAIELCFRLNKINYTEFTAYTYLSIPQLVRHLGITYFLLDEQWTGEYKFHGTDIWDSARRLERGMYRPGQKQCLSFGNGKPLQLGKGGAILLDNIEEYQTLSKMRSDGRDLHQSPWQDYPVIAGYHYCPTLETCKKGLLHLPYVNESPKYHHYPDCRKLNWTSSS
jgi:dTDP-4-amino-4,6-dideoxygalactose transaminase